MRLDEMLGGRAYEHLRRFWSLYGLLEDASEIARLVRFVWCATTLESCVDNEAERRRGRLRSARNNHHSSQEFFAEIRVRAELNDDDDVTSFIVDIVLHRSL